MRKIRNSANRAVVDLRVQPGQPSRIAYKTIDKVDDLLGPSGVNLVYGGYPYDPCRGCGA